MLSCLSIKVISLPNFDAHKRIGFYVSIAFTIPISILLLKYAKLEIGLHMFFLPIVIWYYSNLPDLDHWAGRLRKYTFKLIFLCLALSGAILAIFGIGPMIAVLTIIGMFGLALYRVKHRGPLHSYLFILFASLPLLYFHWLLFVVGYIAGCSHIFVDRFWSKLKRKVKKKMGIKESETTYPQKPTVYIKPKDSSKKMSRVRIVEYEYEE